MIQRNQDSGVSSWNPSSCWLRQREGHLPGGRGRAREMRPEADVTKENGKPEPRHRRARVDQSTMTGMASSPFDYLTAKQPDVEDQDKSRASPASRLQPDAVCELAHTIAI